MGDNPINLRRRVLVIGALEPLGIYITRASAEKADFTLVMLPDFQSVEAQTNEVIQEFKELGVAFIKGDIYNAPKLLLAVRAVEVVIWIHNMGFQTITRGAIEIVEAMRTAQTITRFIVAGFGFDADRMVVFPAAQPFLHTWCQMKRLIENSGIPYTFIVPNFLAVGVFGRRDNEDPTSLPFKFLFYGDGNTKVVFTDEKDVGAYTICTADDPRTIKKILYIMSPENIMSLNELQALWDNKINGLSPRTPYISEAELIQMYINEAQQPVQVELSIMHSAFIRGDQTNFPIDSSFGEVASNLYPEVGYTTMDVYLNKFLPPGPH